MAAIPSDLARLLSTDPRLALAALAQQGSIPQPRQAVEGPGTQRAYGPLPVDGNVLLQEALRNAYPRQAPRIPSWLEMGKPPVPLADQISAPVMPPSAGGGMGRMPSPDQVQVPESARQAGLPNDTLITGDQLAAGASTVKQGAGDFMDIMRAIRASPGDDAASAAQPSIMARTDITPPPGVGGDFSLATLPLSSGAPGEEFPLADGGLAPTKAPAAASLDDNAKAARTALELQKADHARGGNMVTGNTPKPSATGMPPEESYAWTAPGKIGDWQKGVRSKFGIDDRGSNKLGISMMAAGASMMSGKSVGDSILAGIVGYQAADASQDRDDARRFDMQEALRRADQQDQQLDLERERFEYTKVLAAQNRLDTLGTPLEQAVKAAGLAQKAADLGISMGPDGGLSYSPTATPLNAESDVGKLRADAYRIAGRGASPEQVEAVYQSLLGDAQKIKGNVGLGGF